MGLFEYAKMAFKPDAHIWISNLATILFTAMVVAVAGYWALLKEQGLHLAIAATEERYRLLFERSLAGAYRKTLDGRILDCNVTFCQMFGYATRQELIGKSFEARYLNSEEHDRYLAKLRVEKVLTNFEQRLLRADGTVISVLNSATLVEAEEGSQPLIKGTMTDITELRNAEQEQRRLAAIVHCSDDAILSLALDGTIETWNTGAERIYGYTAKEIIGKTAAMLAPPDRPTEYLRILERIAAGQEERVETVRVNKDGRHIDLSLAVSPITDGAGQVVGAATIVRDITDQKIADRALRRSEVQYRLLFDRNPVPMWVFDRLTFRFLAVNEAAIRQYGYSAQEFLEMTLMDIRPEGEIPALLEDLKEMRRGLQRPAAWKHRRKDGSTLDVEIVCHDLDFQGNEAMLVAAFDVTEQKNAQEAAREAEAKYRGIFENSVVGIFQHTPDGRLTAVNRALAEMHGYLSPEEMLADVSSVALQLFVEPNRMIELSRIAVKEGVVRAAEVEAYKKDRSRFWTRLSFRTVYDAMGAIVNFEGTVEDITDRKAAEARVLYLAYYDALTDLPNRTLFKDRLEMALAGAPRRDDQVALLFIDLDQFKIIGDSLGHTFGDLILKAVAQRLRESVREQDTLARIGSDEFIVLLNAVRGLAEAGSAAQRLMDSMARPFEIQGRTINMSCSVGISVFPQHGLDAESLLKNAETAMHSAKEEGRNTFRFFSEKMNGYAAEELALESALRIALARNEFFLVYQPQMDLATGKTAGMEALIRWQHPELGLIPPDRFIHIAENSGLILPIGEWVLRTACAQVRQWQSHGLPVVPVAVNVSAVQFRNENFCSLVQAVLDETGLRPEYLELELTESLLLSNADRTFPVLHELNAMGIRLAIDDFGTGYSSLSYLKQFRVSKLKIDRSFVRDLPMNSDDVAITKAIISMAKSLRLTVIAEGVESEEQMLFLRDNNCDEIQGYYFSRPVLPEEMSKYLNTVPGSHALSVVGQK